MNRATRRSADGRWPVDNGTHAFDVAIQQVRAAKTGSGSRPLSSGGSSAHILDSEELTILTGWAEAVAEVLAYAPEHADAVLRDARTGAAWRSALGLPEPAHRLSRAIDSMGRVVRAAAPAGGTLTIDALLTATKEDQPEEDRLDSVVRHVLLSMLEERSTRRPEPKPA
jgi:hypothetical protein